MRTVRTGQSAKPLYQNLLALNVANNSDKYQASKESSGNVVDSKRGVHLPLRIRLGNPFFSKITKSKNILLPFSHYHII
jgi:hypothetical protein